MSWELISEEQEVNRSKSWGKEIRTERMKVPKGWIVRTTVTEFSAGFWAIESNTTTDTTFVEDIDHEWLIE